MSKCMVDGCDNERFGGGYFCADHAKCIVDGCEEKATVGGYFCADHADKPLYGLTLKYYPGDPGVTIHKNRTESHR